MRDARGALFRPLPLLLSLAAISLGGCTVDHPFNDPTWKGKTWIDPAPGEKMSPDKVYGGII